MTMGDTFGPGERQPQLRGVSGWLLFLCITLMVFLPLRLAFFVWGILTSFDAILSSPDWANLTSPDAVVFAGVILIPVLALPLLGIVGGVLLYREKRLGLRLVQVFFGLQVLFGTIALIAGATGALAIALPSAAWLAYLFRSERVRTPISRIRAGTRPKCSGDGLS
jgi:hypothetical protein